MTSLILKPSREKSLLRRHPWIFSGAVAHLDGNAGMGETVDILSATGDFLAKAAYSPNSSIRARAWGWLDTPVDADFLRLKLDTAIHRRASFAEINAYRLIHAESDGIPGLIVDKYDDVLVMQILTAGAEYWKETLADLLIELTGIKDIYERSDVEVRKLEGLEEKAGILRGNPPDKVEITEYGIRFTVDIAHGHKTGFYLDQRENRHLVGQFAKDRDVLNCFSYTGGFSIHATAGGAKSVMSIDSSGEALKLGAENAALNGQASSNHEWLEGDVFQELRKFRDSRRDFDMIILDPPKFAPTRSQVKKAARGYKDINLLAFKLLRPGGVLVTYSCSGGVDAPLFQKIVAGAALDAGVDAQIIRKLSQGTDHPVALNFPEGAYLKGLVCRKT
ncbi:MAG: 23S rRNA (cytosine(1962)-C(5))-methyltransferase RlmI [Anaerolineae bacterium]|nr:23S rRNA (cytosine(1962)-C(5))-methyltransferase RlmI [Anaerolineae bacterium]MBT3713283.1 23S rRNA (cytosine(1962)-C(5))-methyltransferase RlmI [Anaerolineae bacterium]MBT4309945.1 23S rRNA (cytosine(1962)-C(5))-methyltransferase RlmI [Anaerolineae bacterium]MBT4456819.1 23S rRNA (cytosine(1962)-C(5))-methyltransferase RlmI [Anaerolineae bacterium]MBT4842857.1 23S rRNA (cytosine(1962)-C(5))-methyltransferase RlmI [Anaerolineae bacterium]